MLGIQHFNADDLRAVLAANQKLRIRVLGLGLGLGLATMAHDVTPELARATIESMDELGALHASAAVKAVLATLQR